MQDFEFFCPMVRTMPAALVVVGYGRSAGNVFSTMAEDPERVNAGRVFNGLEREFGGTPFTVKDIFQRVNSSVDSTILREPLEDVGCFDGYSINRSRLGWWLRKKVGWTVDGIRLNLVSVDTHTKQPKISTFYQQASEVNNYGKDISTKTLKRG